MTDIREYLARKPLLFDGGMGAPIIKRHRARTAKWPTSPTPRA